MCNFRKIPTIFALIILINICNGEVEICLKLKSGYSSTQTGNIEEISTLLEKSGKEIKDALDATGLVSAQTTHFDFFHLNMSHAAITIGGDFTNGNVTQEEPDTRLFTLVSDGFEIFNLTIPTIYINGSYTLAGYIGAHRLFDIYGTGDFYLNMTKFSVAAVTSLTKNSTHLCMPITVKLYVAGCKSNFGELMGGDPLLEPLINGDIEAIVPEAITIMYREDADWADPFIQNVINQILSSNSNSLPYLLYLLSNNKDNLASLLNSSR
ncbi:unnamed protein product [Ceutorhynchus assimilis]|uniref:Uncharacterized protein n=1 Tax=Ceutorhynchus assimilis TaxID=467358 RepID=A0A9N9MPK5_9CUCU|nr:unnamed protein product [Ceutorhynchus assimilis]